MNRLIKWILHKWVLPYGVACVETHEKCTFLHVRLNGCKVYSLTLAEIRALTEQMGAAGDEFSGMTFEIETLQHDDPRLGGLS